MSLLGGLVALAVIGQVLAAFWLGIWFEQRASKKQACPKCGVVCNSKEGWCGCSVCPGCKRDDMVSRTEGGEGQ